MIKPDCVRRRMVGVIITSIESIGLEIINMQQKILTEQEASNLYKEHEGKWHFKRNIKHVTSGPIVIIEVAGEDAVEKCRGFVDCFREAHQDVIQLPKNLIHATSDVSRVYGELEAVGFSREKTPSLVDIP